MPRLFGRLQPLRLAPGQHRLARGCRLVEAAARGQIRRALEAVDLPGLRLCPEIMRGSCRFYRFDGATGNPRRDGVPVEADEPSQPDVRDAVRIAAERFGGEHVVVNCAGVGFPGRVLTRDDKAVDLDRFEFVIRVNLIGSFNVIRLAAAVVSISAGRSQRDGPGATAPPAGAEDETRTRASAASMRSRSDRSNSSIGSGIGQCLPEMGLGP